MSQPTPTEAPPAALPVVKGTLDLLALKALAGAPREETGKLVRYSETVTAILKAQSQTV